MYEIIDPLTDGSNGSLNASEKKMFLAFKSLICGESALIKNITYADAEKNIR